MGYDVTAFGDRRLRFDDDLTPLDGTLHFNDDLTPLDGTLHILRGQLWTF
jgi:hypothetical protein